MSGLKRSFRSGLGSRKISIDVLSSISITDPGGQTGFGSAPIYLFPKKDIVINGLVAYLVFSSASAGLISTWSGNVSLGTSANADGSLTGSEVDVIPSAAIGPAVGKAIAAQRLVMPQSIAGLALDATLQPPLYINMLVADASLSANSIITVSGKVYASILVF